MPRVRLVPRHDRDRWRRDCCRMSPVCAGRHATKLPAAEHQRSKGLGYRRHLGMTTHRMVRHLEGIGSIRALSGFDQR